MRHGSLFSGIGGFDLAINWMGWTNTFQVEKDEFCLKILEKNFPFVSRFNDVKTFDGTKYRGAIDIISGGFPCQPFSTAGSRKGTDDERYLWPEMLRVIREVRPRYFVGENVSGIADWDEGLVIETVCSEVENIGYQVTPFSIPACAIGAQHRRNRIWFIGCLSNPGGVRFSEFDEIKERYKRREWRETQRFPKPLHRISDRFYRSDGSEVVGDSHGVSRELDKDRIKGLGNAIVPQVAYELFKIIEIIDQKI